MKRSWPRKFGRSWYVLSHCALHSSPWSCYLYLWFPKVAEDWPPEPSRRQVRDDWWSALQGYHVLALVLFAPALVLQPVMLVISLAIACALMIIIEALRVSNFPIIAPRVHAFMTSFIDERDSGLLLVRYVALPVTYAMSLDSWSVDNSHLGSQDPKQIREGISWLSIAALLNCQLNTVLPVWSSFSCPTFQKFLAFEAHKKFPTNFSDYWNSKRLQTSSDVQVSHFSLLIGMAAPVWLLGGSSLKLEAHALFGAFSGIIILGIADSAASGLGRRYGRNKILGTKKSAEGTLGGIVCNILAWCCLRPLAENMSITRIIYASVASCLLEASTTQLDNVFLPLHHLTFML